MSLELADLLETIALIDTRTKLFVFGYIRQSQRLLFDVDHKNDTFYTIPEWITFQCLLFYYIDPHKTRLMANIYDLWMDPTFCGNDIELSQWYTSLNRLHFNGDNTIKQQIFEYMDHDNDGWIHRSDFVIFTTSRFEDKKLQKLQESVLDATDHSNGDNAEYIERQQRVASSKQKKLSKLEMHCQIVRRGIIPRKAHEAQKFKAQNVINWVIHQVIDWMDSIGMEHNSKYFADFERPMSGQRLLNYKNIYQFRLEIDFKIETHDALHIVQEIDKLRQFVAIEDKIIDYIEEAKWLHQSFELLQKRYCTICT
eukprot:170659_1